KIKEFGVRRLLARCAEVINAVDKAGAEEPGPDAIDHDAGGEGIFGAADPFGQLLPARVDDFGSIAMGGGFEEAARSNRPEIMNTATDVNGNVAGIFCRL